MYLLHLIMDRRVKPGDDFETPYAISKTAPRSPRQQLRAIFEVHGVVVIPGAAPDEAVLLEDAHDRDGNAVAPARRLARRPAPVVRVSRVDVDRHAIGMH